MTEQGKKPATRDIVIKDVPAAIADEFDSITGTWSVSHKTNQVDYMYGHDENERARNLFTHLVVDMKLEEAGLSWYQYCRSDSKGKEWIHSEIKETFGFAVNMEKEVPWTVGEKWIFDEQQLDQISPTNEPK